MNSKLNNQKNMDEDEVMKTYLEYIIDAYEHLKWAYLSAEDDKPAQFELKEMYIQLRVKYQRSDSNETKDSSSINAALAAHPRLVVLGGPGSGKTTLLLYLALRYARDRLEGTSFVKRRLGLDESGWLPIAISVGELGEFLRKNPDKNEEKATTLLKFLDSSLKKKRVKLPKRFFENELKTGRAVILLDGLDEAVNGQRKRVCRLIEAFTQEYPDCRYIVTCRKASYNSLSGDLGADYIAATLQNFTLDDVKLFLEQWYEQMAPGQDAPESWASDQATKLFKAIKAKDRLREDLAVNPLMLTLMATLHHNDQVELPERRVELYAKAIKMLLGGWDELKEVYKEFILRERCFDLDLENRLQKLLQKVALHMQEQEQRDIPEDELCLLLEDEFGQCSDNSQGIDKAVNRFLKVIQEQVGLLAAAENKEGYLFFHRTFREYLAALEIAKDPDDYTTYNFWVSEPWWREVILLAAGHRSTDRGKGPEPIELDWVEISAGKFWMGTAEKARQVNLRRYYITRTPVTNAQYYLFIQETGRQQLPDHWIDGRPPPDSMNHPVVHLDLSDIGAYCAWLIERTDKAITLPCAAEWEKAARGADDKRLYPWGDVFDKNRCNCKELGLGRLTPVDHFPEGRSPYGCLDMAGNVWEWTRSVYGQKDPEASTEQRTDLDANTPRVMRGGSFNNPQENIGCIRPLRDFPFDKYGSYGFRVVYYPPE